MSEIQQIGGSIEYGNTGDIVEDARLIIDSAQRSAHQAVNVALVVRNWLLGRRIVEEELGDVTRSETYGRKVVPMLAKELTATYGKGYTRTSLYQYVQFYRMFPEIVHAASGQSHVLLTWTHYRELLRVQNDDAARGTSRRPPARAGVSNSSPGTFPASTARECCRAVSSRAKARPSPLARRRGPSGSRS